MLHLLHSSSHSQCIQVRKPRCQDEETASHQPCTDWEVQSRCPELTCHPKSHPRHGVGVGTAILAAAESSPSPHLCSSAGRPPVYPKAERAPTPLLFLALPTFLATPSYGQAEKAVLSGLLPGRHMQKCSKKKREKMSLTWRGEGVQQESEFVRIRNCSGICGDGGGGGSINLLAHRFRLQNGIIYSGEPNSTIGFIATSHWDEPTLKRKGDRAKHRNSYLPGFRSASSGRGGSPFPPPHCSDLLAHAV